MTSPTALSTLIDKPKTIPDMYEVAMSQQLVPVPAPPKDLVDFRALSREQRYKYVKTGGTIETNFFIQPHIQEYLECKWAAELSNRDLFIQLWEAYGVEQDLARRAALEAKMTAVKYAIIGQQHKFWALCLNWKKYPFAEQKKKADKVDWDQ